MTDISGRKVIEQVAIVVKFEGHPPPELVWLPAEKKKLLVQVAAEMNGGKLQLESMADGAKFPEPKSRQYEPSPAPTLDQLSPSARSAAIRGGMAGWGQVANAKTHIRYMEKMPSTSRKKCSCGCGQRATHAGMANGLALMTGCELVVRRWVRTGER